jgi:hypothetical protein
MAVCVDALGNASTTHGLPPGVEKPELASYTVAGICDAIKR